MYVKTGRKITKLVCERCGLEKVIDHRKRDKYYNKMKKHLRSCVNI